MTASIRVTHHDARSMSSIPSGSIHAVITSPPYYGLRKYNAGAGEIGGEETPEQFIAAIVEVAREVRRVLRDDGSFWLNLGDTYAGGSGGDRNPGTMRQVDSPAKALHRKPVKGSPAKSLLLIPSRVVRALQLDGWIVRAEVPWVKRNAMPGSQQDRPTVAHEAVYLLTKGPRYFFDMEAVRRCNKPGGIAYFEAHGGRRDEIVAAKATALRAQGTSQSQNPNGGIGYNASGRAWRTTDPSLDALAALADDCETYAAHVRAVLTDGGMLMSPEGDPLSLVINTMPSKLKHFAMWPPRLVAEMVRASTSEKGCCAACGTPWRRVVEKTLRAPDSRWSNTPITRLAVSDAGQGTNGTRGSTLGMVSASETVGWEASCSCPPSAPIPCRVLDPFGGTGTTAAVAEALGREGWHNELGEGEYGALLDARRAEVRKALGVEDRPVAVELEKQPSLFAV